MSRTAAVVSVGFLLCTACGPDVAELTDPANEAIETQDELSACSRAAYAEALAHYKTAVAWSKERLASGVCESEHGFLWDIADEASRAVMGCSDFRAVIRTSPWAAPLRTALARSLTLSSLTGELQVVKRSGWENWTGTEASFQKSRTFWARSQGAYGPPVRLDFAPDGSATWGEQVFNQTTGDITWRSARATWVISLATGKASGPRVLSVTRGARTVKFSLGVQNALEYRAAPVFVLQPLGGQAGAPPPLLSLVTECEA